jgi:hypothetical protein
MRLRLLSVAAWAAIAFAPGAAHAADAPRFEPPAPYVSLRGGYALRSFYGLPVDAGVVGLGLGGRSGRLSFYLSLDALFGATREGLSVRQLDLGARAELAFGRLRVGLGPYVGALSVERITKPETLTGLSVGGRAQLTTDVASWGRAGGAFFGVELSAGVAGSGAFYGPSLIAGGRAF